jgi:mono/diheme cytochrome c family protein
MPVRQSAPFAVGLALALAATASAEPSKPADKVARGKYLVEQAGQCQDCHSPRNEKGEYVREQWLLGSELPFKATIPMPWIAAAPPIAGLPTLSQEQAVHFLMTGERPGKPRVTPPMPEYRFSREDAEAIAAFLKSLAK